VGASLDGVKLSVANRDPALLYRLYRRRLCRRYRYHQQKASEPQAAEKSNSASESTKSHFVHHLKELVAQPQSGRQRKAALPAKKENLVLNGLRTDCDDPTKVIDAVSMNEFPDQGQ